MPVCPPAEILFKRTLKWSAQKLSKSSKCIFNTVSDIVCLVLIENLVAVVNDKTEITSASSGEHAALARA
jgi:hypothetical protein